MIGANSMGEVRNGLTVGEGNFSEEEIDAALYRLTPEWIDEIATISPFLQQSYLIQTLW